VAKQTNERTAKVAPWIGAGILSASLLKSTIDRISENKWAQDAAKNAKSVSHNAKHIVGQTSGNVQSLIEDRLPLSQLQIDKIAQALSDQVQGVTGRFTGKAVVAKKTPSYRGWWIAGIGLGFATAGATAFVVTRRRMNKQEDQELVALPEASANGHHTPATRLRNAVGTMMQRSTPTPTPAPTEATPSASTTNTATLTTTAQEITDPSQAKFIGNIRTMILHPSDSDHLPAEENRIYFLTEADASQAGYRLAEGE